jgi:hypothetical protein
MYFNVVKTLIFSLSGIKMGWKKFELGGRILDAIDTTIYRLAMADFQTTYDICPLWANPTCFYWSSTDIW